MIVAGLTGGIASGKSTVARLFRDMGCHIIDLDRLSRVVVEPDRPAWRDIVGWLGHDVLNRDRTLNRRRVAEMVFANTNKRKHLEKIVHPRVFKDYEKKLISIRDKDSQAIVIADIPLLMEIDVQHRFDRVIVVYVPPDEQIARLIRRDGLTRQAALDRLKSQMPIDEKTKAADYVIDNTGSVEKTEQQVRAVHGALAILAREENERRSS